jgi:phage baseplate assembly protein W
MVATQEVQYVDLDLNLTPHPVTGDIVLKTGHSAVSQAIKTLVLTNFFERPFHSDVGANLRGEMFELYSPIVAKRIERNVNRSITNDEPRAQLMRLVVDERRDQNGVRVVIVFRPIHMVSPVTVELFLKRVR